MKRDVDDAESGLQALKKALDFDLKDYGESYEPPRIANPVVQHANEDRMSERKYRSANVPYTLRLIWERLDARFGSPEMIEFSLHSRIVNFPKLSNDNRKELYDLADLAAEIYSIRRDEKWTTTVNGYKSKNNGAYPPFSFFVPFLQNIAKVLNNPGFIYDNQDTKPTTSKQTRFQSPTQVSIIKTDIGNNDYRPPFQKSNEDLCPLHGTNHTLNTCRGFRCKPLSERLGLVKQKGLCFKCCGPKRHFRDKCKEDVKCSVCGSCDHPSALHVDVENEPQQKHEEESSNEQIIVRPIENGRQISNHGTKSFDMNLGCNSEKPTHVVDTVASNCRSVLEAFQSDDLATNLKDLDIVLADLLLQMSLGLSLDTELDEFTLRVSSDYKPFTRQGFLSTVNSLYDQISLARTSYL
ncbi:unnamed protein product [Mytilus edulis]|uniref:Uncharacterized protein n=1 Tax=Mytilus edulis TaxID=6550 RepID=A0A8S3RHJ5_MYTED|nr:unnamed protein product [Mytilus edulis]